MSTEFNHKRAWKEYVQPEYLKLSKQVHEAFNALYDQVDSIYQVGASMTVTGYTPELMAMFDAIPFKDLAWAHEVVFYYGHLASGKEGQKAGAYWKFRNMASMSLINRRKTNSTVMETLHQAKAKMENILKNFDDHEEGTDYNNDELPGYLLKLSPNLGKGILKIYKAVDINHKPDIFCIGNEHMRKSTGMYLDPNVAPCANCRQPYSAHTYDRVIALKPIVGSDPDTFLKDNEDKVKAILTHIKELCEASKTRLDGFVFVKP